MMRPLPSRSSFTAEHHSEAAWFRFAGWLTVEIDDETTLAISPRSSETPHFIFEVGRKTVPIGGAWELAAAIAVADRLCSQCGGAFWRRDQRKTWGGHATSPQQYGMLRGLGATKLEREYANWNRGVASGMIGFLQARRRLLAAGWWAEPSMPLDRAAWAPERLVAALQAEGLPVDLRFPDAAQGPGPAPIPWTPGSAAAAVAQLLGDGTQPMLHGDEPSPKPLVVVSDGAGVSRALAELGHHPNLIRCDLAGVSGARRMLMTLAASLVGGDPHLPGGSTMDVGSWLEEMLISGESMATLVLDHCPRLPTDILHWIDAYQIEGARLVFVVRSQAEAARIEKQLRSPLEIVALPLLGRAEVERQALPAIVAALGFRCDHDEAAWIADELWTWLRDGDRGVRWRDLGAVASALAEPGRIASGVLDQAAIQRLRAIRPT